MSCCMRGTESLVFNHDFENSLSNIFVHTCLLRDVSMMLQEKMADRMNKCVLQPQSASLPIASNTNVTCEKLNGAIPAGRKETE